MRMPAAGSAWGGKASSSVPGPVPLPSRASPGLCAWDGSSLAPGRVLGAAGPSGQPRGELCRGVDAQPDAVAN